MLPAVKAACAKVSTQPVTQHASVLKRGGASVYDLYDMYGPSWVQGFCTGARFGASRKAIAQDNTVTTCSKD